MKRYLANLLTGSRIFGSLLLALLPACSIPFYAVYGLCGLSDMLDGPIARRTGSAGAAGARLDTAADILFAAVSLGKLLPALQLPAWVLIWAGAIAAIRVLGAAAGFLRYHKLVSIHSALNKAAGLLLFLFPLTLHGTQPQASAAVVCAVATAAALQEGYWVAAGHVLAA